MAEPSERAVPAGASTSAWLVALATANFLVLVALAFLVRWRLGAIEDRLDTKDARPEARRAGDPAPAPRGPRPKESDAPAEGDASVSKRLQEISETLYDKFQDIQGEQHDAKRQLTQILATVRRLQQQLAAPGSPTGYWALSPKEKPPTPETIEAYRRDAANWGVKVEPGRVEVRGFLNMSPWSTMPIEYFVTRWPESGHETLLHVVGPKKLDEDLTSDSLRGLVSAIYKGLVAAGFAEGVGSRFDAPAPGDSDPKDHWVPPTGDVVYVGVRYMLRGKVHVARATDWVIDPTTKPPSVLPENAFRFTGSLRRDDYQSGDEQVSAEAGGIVVSVYMDPNAMVEIALKSNLDDRYQYNYARIPKPLVVKLGRLGPLVTGQRDRQHDAMTLDAIERDGNRSPIEKAPVLLAKRSDGSRAEVPFSKSDGGWTVSDESLQRGEWSVRVEVDGQAVESVGAEPLYMDLIFSKTPIVPEGDGALPVVVEADPNGPKGTGTKPAR